MSSILVAIAAVDLSALAPWQALLDPAEQEAADRFAMAEDRASYLVSHGLRRGLCQVVLGRQGLTFAPREPLGKPDLVGPCGGLDVSISHTRGAVACAVGVGCKVGVDLERIDRPFDDQVAGQVFTPGERNWIGVDGGERSLTLWTLKEAISKAVGLGLSLGFSDLALRPDPWRIEAAPAACGMADDWTLESWQAMDSHLAALAFWGRGAALPAEIMSQAAEALPPGVTFLARG